MSDSRNAAEAIPRNYATSVRAAPQAIPAIQFLNTSLSPVSCSLLPFTISFLVSPLHSFSYASSRPVVHGGLLPSTLTHTRAVTDSADILVPSIPGISLLSNVRPNGSRPGSL